MSLSRTSRLTWCAVGVALVIGVVYAPATEATSRSWTVGIGDAPVQVTATYPTVSVPASTDLLDISLPTGFDWAPADLAAPAPAVTWTIERAGAVVGAASTPAAPDAGVLEGFGSTASIDFSDLPTAPAQATGYTLRIHAVWASYAPADAGDVLDLRVPFDVVAPGADADVALDLGFAHATAETRSYAVAYNGNPTGGDALYVSTAGAPTPWTWETGPDPAQAWSTRALVRGGLGTGATDPLSPTQSLDGLFSVSTPDPSTLVVPLPNVVHNGVDTLALTATSRVAPSSGPVVTVVVSMSLLFNGAASGLTANPRPAISGTAVFGQTLSVSSGTWAPTSNGNWAAGALTLHYQWYRGTGAIGGATGTTYPLTVADVGKVLTVRVIASTTGYVTTTVATTGVGVRAAAAPRLVVRPVLVGAVKVKHVVTARVGTWRPAPTAYRYQWLNNGIAIRGGQSAKLTLTRGLRGHLVRCRITAIKGGYVSGVAVTPAYRVK